jgi:hypothetical protein
MSPWQLAAWAFCGLIALICLLIGLAITVAIVCWIIDTIRLTRQQEETDGLFNRLKFSTGTRRIE